MESLDLGLGLVIGGLVLVLHQLRILRIQISMMLLSLFRLVDVSNM
jgi:hypothetical protein